MLQQHECQIILCKICTQYHVSLFSGIKCKLNLDVLNFCCYFTETKSAVTDPLTEGIQYIDEKVDGENNEINRDEDTKSEVDEDIDKERDEDPNALHINRVNLMTAPRENDRARLRVCVEITHPALKLPVYRTWTGETQLAFRDSGWMQ